MKQITTLLLIWTSINVSAQEWISLPLDEGVWSTHYYTIGDLIEWKSTSTRHYSTLGDTLINGTNYKKLVSNMDTITNGNQTLEVDQYVGAIIEENKILSIIRAGSTAIDTIYDLNISIGAITASELTHDISFCGGNGCPWIQLESIDDVTLDDGIPRMRYNFDVYSDNTHFHSHSIIEGIGSTLGLFNDPIDNLNLPYSIVSCHGQRQLLCLDINGNSTYRGDRYNGDCNILKPITVSSTDEVSYNDINIFPNPVSEILYFQETIFSDNSSYNILDLQGKVIQTNNLNRNQQIEVQDLSPGIYFLSIRSNNTIYRSMFVKVD